MLDVVDLGELAARVGRDELVEFALGLSAQIGAVHEEEDALGPGVLDQPVGERTGGVGLARAGGHLDEGPGTRFGERLLQMGDAFNLAGPEVLCGQRMGSGKVCEPGTQGFGLGNPFGQRLGAVKGEDAA